jgi:hypothetical protein
MLFGETVAVYCEIHTQHKNTLCGHNHSLSCRWALLEEPPIVQLLKNFPAFYGTRRFITVLTEDLHWPLSSDRSTQSTPSHPISLRSILILTTHLWLGLPSGLFPSGFPTDILHALLFAPFVQHALPFTSFLTRSLWLYVERSTSYEAPHYAVFSNLLSLHPSLV